MARPCHRVPRKRADAGRTVSDVAHAQIAGKKAGRQAAGIAHYSNSFQERPSRVIIATEATGPQVPA